MSERPTPRECCRFVSSQMRAAGFAPYADRINELIAENERLDELINAPQVNRFLKAVRLEAAHQCERWGVENDAGKTPADWFWLIGYLAGKALSAAILGNKEKALHHAISTAAACLNWHGHMTGARTLMRPGIDEPKGERHA